MKAKTTLALAIIGASLAVGLFVGGVGEYQREHWFQSCRVEWTNGEPPPADFESLLHDGWSPYVHQGLDLIINPNPPFNVRVPRSDIYYFRRAAIGLGSDRSFPGACGSNSSRLAYGITYEAPL